MDLEPPKPEASESQPFYKKGVFKNIALPAPSYMLIGFMMIAIVSAWLNLEQAQTVDSYGDVLSEEAQVREIQTKLSKQHDLLKDTDTKLTAKDGIRDSIKKLNIELNDSKESLHQQKQDVLENSADMLNGSWFWTVFIQLGCAAFGIGLINIITSKKEDSRVRSAAILVIGAVVLFLLLSRILALSSVSGILHLGS